MADSKVYVAFVDGIGDGVDRRVTHWYVEACEVNADAVE